MIDHEALGGDSSAFSLSLASAPHPMFPPTPFPGPELPPQSQRKLVVLLFEDVSASSSIKFHRSPTTSVY